jgi:glycosyltransferase involved in cell wall biosynthesis
MTRVQLTDRLGNQMFPDAAASAPPRLGDNICEIRIPTYRRPKLLHRALRSVADQTYPHWRCVVFDDCRDGSARKIVEECNDLRFQYRQNDLPLGAIGNIDQCFRNQPFADGQYACVVEDDNFLLPRHLECQLDTCARHHVDVTLSAQLCEKVIVPGEPGELIDAKTLVWIYPSGRHACQEILPAILFSHAFSNGAAFWRIGYDVDFEIGDATKHPGIQETARVLRLRRDVYVSHEATAVWRSNDPSDSFVNKMFAAGWPGKLTKRWLELIERRQAMALRCCYIRKYGMDDAMKFSVRFGSTHQERIERMLLLCGRYVVLTDRSLTWRISRIIQGFAFRTLIPPGIDLRKVQTR